MTGRNLSVVGNKWMIGGEGGGCCSEVAVDERTMSVLCGGNRLRVKIVRLGSARVGGLFVHFYFFQLGLW